jgi:hypothetical protein
LSTSTPAPLATKSRYSLGRARFGSQWAITAALLSTVAVTNRWLSWSAGYRLLRAHDEADYRVIAAAAPHLPSQHIQDQHAQRFVPHYLLGLVSHGWASLDTTYAVGAILVALVLSGVLGAVLIRIHLSTAAFAICMGAFVLNTYSLRYYGLAPAEFSDLLLEVGLLIVIWGLSSGRFWLVLAGVVFATLARQTAVPATLAAAYWLAAGPNWRQGHTAARVARSLSIVLASLALWLVLKAIAEPFSQTHTPDLAHFTMLADIERLPHGLGQLGQHFLRSINGLLTVFALLAAVLAATRRLHLRAPLPFEFWGCLFIGLCVAIQPVIFSPEYAAHNETRLAVLGLPAFVCALAYAMRRQERSARPPRTRATVAVLAILAIGSLHHLYTVIGPASAGQTVALQIITAASAAVVLFLTADRDEDTEGTSASALRTDPRTGLQEDPAVGRKSVQPKP